MNAAREPSAPHAATSAGRCRKGINRTTHEAFHAALNFSESRVMNVLRSSLAAASALARQPRAPVQRTECLAGQTLLAVARQRQGLDSARCQVVLEHLNVAQALQLALHRVLASHRLTDLQFAVMVALFALDPEPVAPTDLADYAAVSRPAVTDALVRLEGLRLVTRTRDPIDRRVYRLHLTPAGRTTIDEAIVSYLAAAGRSARHVDSEALTVVRTVFAGLQKGAAELSA